MMHIEQAQTISELNPRNARVKIQQLTEPLVLVALWALEGRVLIREAIEQRAGKLGIELPETIPPSEPPAQPLKCCPQCGLEVHKVEDIEVLFGYRRFRGKVYVQPQCRACRRLASASSRERKKKQAAAGAA